MKMTLYIMRRELRAMFLSPLAWTILAVVQFILAYLFLTQLSEFIRFQPQLKSLAQSIGVTDVVISPMYGSASFILMLVVPLITMRVISEERRNKSLTLLFSAPVSMTEIVLGKYLGVVAFLMIMIGMISIMPLSLMFAGPIDTGLFLATLLGVTLLVTSFAAVGVYFSSLTVQPTVAAIGTFGILLLLWIIDWAGARVADPNTTGVLTYLSMLRHFESLAKGVFNTSDVAYYLLFIGSFLTLSVRRLDADRLQH